MCCCAGWRPWSSPIWRWPSFPGSAGSSSASVCGASISDFSQGLLSALVADTAPEDLRGTAFGLFNLVTGGALLAASVLAGWLWYGFGPTATFTAGAVFSGFAILVVAFGIKAAPARRPDGARRHPAAATIRSSESRFPAG